MRSGSLVVLAMVFLCAFGGRAAVMAAAVAEKIEPHHGEEVAASSSSCVNGAFAQSLREELESLEARKVKLAEKEQTMRVLSDHLESRIAELEILNNSLLDLAEKSDARNNEEVRRVAVIYEQMKPSLAGGIIGAMDPNFAAGLMLAMTGENASAIMATLDADKAYKITVLMARLAAHAN
jgi:flagellar motility protein MotE (MotC chaperone)